MFYAVQKSTEEEISYEKISGEEITAGFISFEELRDCYDELGFSETTVKDCRMEPKNFRSSIDIYDDYCFGLLSIINSKDIYGDRDRIGFYIKKNLFLLVKITDENNSMEEIFQYAINRFKPENLTFEKLVYGFFERLLYGDNKTLENIGAHITSLEEEMVIGKMNNQFNSDIFEMKKEVLLLHNYYEQLIDIGEELQENENDIFLEENLRYFKIFTDKAGRLSDNTKMLMDSLIHLREAHQAGMDYDLNRIMKVFTVVTTVFLPLTLIVGWYGMNFVNMPELSWKYGYTCVIVVSIIVVIVCFWFFKKKKFL